MNYDPATQVLHAGARRLEGDPIVEPIFAASIYAMEGRPEHSTHYYGRYHSPNWTALENALGSLEGGRSAVFASGMAACHALILCLCKDRKRLVCPSDGYFGLRRLAEMLRPFSIDPVFADLTDLDGLKAHLRREASVLWVETPTNPYLKVADLEALSRLARQSGAPMVVDNTTATPVLQKPLEFGAVASLYSLTKAIAGHADVVLGAVTTKDEPLLDQLRNWRTVAGSIAGPFEAWLAHRGLRTLPLRITRQSETAMAVARHLRDHGRVARVHYPGLDESSSGIAARQMPVGFGPLLSFEFDGDLAATDRAVRASRIIQPATSFGGVESSWERRARWASETASESLVRLSIGLESADDLIADIDAALSKA